MSELLIFIFEKVEERIIHDGISSQREKESARNNV